MDVFDKIVFFELRHYGDLHITRAFVRYVIDHIPAQKYVYVLTASPKVFSDFPELTFENYDENVHLFSAYSAWKLVDNILYINTSCGTNEMAFYKGTTIQTAHAIFSHYLKEFCDYTLPNDLKLFIPTIDFNSFKIKNVDIFMEQYKDKKKILIVNGEGQSGQVINFDVYPLIQLLSYRHPNYMFFVSNIPTNGVYVHNTMCKIVCPLEKNIFYCKNIINIDENDIIETTYFSLFCDMIIGRSSGVYTLSIERNNVVNKPKKFICISFTERDKDLGLVGIVPSLASNFIWSDNFNFGSMLNVIESNIL